MARPCPRGSWVEYFEGDLRANLDAAVDAGALTPAAHARALELWGAAAPPPARPRWCTPTCVGPTCVSARAGSSRGLIDFADIMVGDPLLDFGALLAVDPRDQRATTHGRAWRVGMAAGSARGA